MRTVSRRLVAGLASAAVAASLLLAPTSAVSSSEVTDTPEAFVTDKTSDSDGSQIESSQTFRETLVRLQVNMGANNPVTRGKVVVRSTEGRLLLRGYTNAVGQAVFLTQQELPDRVVVRVTGGKSKGARGKSIDLRAFFEPRDGKVVDVNPLTTMDELCRSGRYGTYCSAAVDSFYRLKGSVNYRDLVAISDRWFDGSRFGREAAKRGLTTWQWAERVLLKAYAGKKARKPKTRAEQSDVTVRSSAGGFAASLAGVGSILAKGAMGGVGSTIASRYFTKLMVVTGMWNAPTDLGVELGSLSSEMRAHFSEVSNGIRDVAVRQAAMKDQVSRLYDAVQEADYQAAVRDFNTKRIDERIDGVLRSWSYLLSHVDCYVKGAQGCTADRGDPETAPVATDACSATSNSGSGARQIAALCADFRRVLAQYANDFNINELRNSVASESRERTSLIPHAQRIFARINQGGIITTSNQGRMIAAGEYWLSKLAEDKAIWALISTDDTLVSGIRGVIRDVARQQISALQDYYDAVSSDESGRFFPQRIDCSWVFYDLETSALYARGYVHFADRREGQSTTDRVINSRPQGAVGAGSTGNGCPSFLDRQGAYGRELDDKWTAVPVSRVPRLGGVAAYLRESFPARGEFEPTRLAVGTWGNEGGNGCYAVALANHWEGFFGRGRGHVVVCPFIDYARSDLQVSGQGMACVSKSRDAMVKIPGRTRYLLVEWVRSPNEFENRGDRRWGDDPWIGCVEPPGARLRGSHDSLDRAVLPGVTYREFGGRPFASAFKPEPLSTWVRYALITRPYDAVPRARG